MYQNKAIVGAILCACFITFHNEAESQADPNYYNSVDDSSPSALRNSLHTIIDDHTRFPYTSSATDTWDILELAGENVDNSNQVITIYKNSTNTKVGGGNNNYNREHSWPSSYGFPDDGSSNYPYTDMHHLFIADSSYNSSRSNKPFDICVSGCDTRPTDFNNGRGGNGQDNLTTTGIWDVWSGRQGDIARALMYLDVRYEGGTHGITGISEPDLILTDNLSLINASATGNNESVAYMGLLSVLLVWHKDDPVDIYEHQHNEAVAAAQGNRNPFIDNPDWVECVFELVCNGGGADTTPPAAVSNLTATVNNLSIFVDWFNNSETDLAGYTVYRSVNNTNNFNPLNSTLRTFSNYTDNNVSAGNTYYYYVTADDNTGNESSNGAIVSATVSGGGSNNQLSNGVAKTGLAGSQGSENFYTLTVPAGATDLSFVMNGGSGDADMYVRFGNAPTTGTYDCRPYLNGNNETCDITNLQAGTYHVMVRGFSSYSGVSLIGSYTAGGNGGGGGGGNFFENTSNVTISSGAPSTVSSAINVSRTGASGTITVKADIKHTWRGDVSARIFAPNGANGEIHARTNTNDSGDDILIDIDLNAGTIESNGQWRIEVTDHVNQDGGFIDSWSIEFN